jgi:hypothetical protein
MLRTEGKECNRAESLVVVQVARLDFSFNVRSFLRCVGARHGETRAACRTAGRLCVQVLVVFEGNRISRLLNEGWQ